MRCIWYLEDDLDGGNLCVHAELCELTMTDFKSRQND